ncbi:MAG: alpha/beta hydrolase, partial [Paracoccaceae bacterium]|nr:alpha/beta hydrolase [Paracoccaceae bacterium]
MGWFYLPDETKGDEKLSLIVMAHGLSGVKEQGLGEVAEIFSSAGYAVVVFDYRHFGDSTGEPRQQIFPLDMVEDYRNAISWACTQPNVDADR